MTHRPAAVAPVTPQVAEPLGWPDIAVRGTWLAGRRTWDPDGWRGARPPDA